MNNQKLWVLLGTFLGVATFAPVLVNAQNATLDAQITGTVNGGQMMRGGGEFRGGMRGEGRINGRGMMPGAVGNVTAISGNTITITEMNRPMKGQATSTKVVTVDATNAIILKNNATTTLSSIVVGDNLMVEGQLTGTNIVATKIRAGMMFKGGMGGATSTMMHDGMMNDEHGNKGGNENKPHRFNGGIKNFFSHLFGF